MSLNSKTLSRPLAHFSYFPSNSSSHLTLCSNGINPSHYKHYFSSVSYLPTDELRTRIHENHLSYLSRDESPFRFELRSKIETLITEYLSITLHSHKFTFREIADCLYQTVRKSDFEPSKAIYAFEAIERYAINLLNYPWRQEYRTIFAFSGFFNRVINSALVSYGKIFELLGYTYDTSLNVYKLIEIPIDPDKVSQVSLECLYAIVECQIMCKIDKLVKTAYPDVSWNDIYSIRTDYICDAENAAKILNDKKKSGKLIDLDLPDYGVKRFNRVDLLTPLSSTRSGTESGSVLLSSSNYLESNLDLIDYIDSSSSDENPVKTLSPSTSILTTSTSSSSTHSFQNNLQSKNNSLSAVGLPESGKEFVEKDYKNSSNLSNATNVDKSKIIRVNPSQIDSVLLSEINQFRTNGGQNVKEEPSSSKKTINEIRKQMNEMKMDNTKVASGPEVARAKMSSVASYEKPGLQQVNSSHVSSWSCKTCTFLNLKSRDVCEMCHRSRVKGGESAPLVSGGRECNQCTLVNNKKEMFCRACGTSLADSPTYI